MDRADLAAALRAISLDIDADMFDRLMVIDTLDNLGVLPAKRSIPIDLGPLSDDDVAVLRALATEIRRPARR